MRLRVLIIAAVALAGLIWLARVVANRRITSTEEPPRDPATIDVASAPEARPAFAPGQQAQPTPADAPPPPAMVVSWEDQRDGILTSNTSTEEKANALLALVPQLAGAEQEEATKHLINLLSDEHFLVAASPLITNTAAPTNVQALLILDLPNRPERVRLPLWLAIARTPEHPHAAEALVLLGQHLAEDHGTDWPAWEAAVDRHLHASP